MHGGASRDWGYGEAIMRFVLLKIERGIYMTALNIKRKDLKDIAKIIN